jgi:UDP-glucose 4-epimerase
MSAERDIVLVTGAAGWIGRQVCENLQKKGQRVAAFDRVSCQGPWSLSFVGGLDSLASPPDELVRLLERTFTVVHCAGRAHRPIETKQEVAAFEETNVGGTRDLVVACRNAGVARIVYVSSIAAYDWARAPFSGALEDGELRPMTAYASTKLQGERVVSESALDWRAVRLATVFGCGDRANLAKLARGIRRKRFVVPGDGCARKSVIPVDLAAEVLTMLALAPTPKHRLMNVALTDAPTLRGLCDDFSLACGFGRAPSIPLSVLRSGAFVGDLVTRLWPAFPLTTSTLNKLTTSTVVDNRRLRETFPDLLMPSFSEALKKSAEYYRNL